MIVVKWYIDGRHRSADDPHLSNSNAARARDAVGAIAQNWWQAVDGVSNFDVVIVSPEKWAGRYPVTVEQVPEFIIGKST